MVPPSIIEGIMVLIFSGFLVVCWLRKYVAVLASALLSYAYTCTHFHIQRLTMRTIQVQAQGQACTYISLFKECHSTACGAQCAWHGHPLHASKGLDWTRLHGSALETHIWYIAQLQSSLRGICRLVATNDITHQPLVSLDRWLPCSS